MSPGEICKMWGSAPAEGHAPPPVPIVVHHGHPATLRLQQRPLQAGAGPAGPQAHQFPQVHAPVQRRLQLVAALQDALRVTWVYRQPPVSLLPGAPDRDAVPTRVDVRVPVAVPDEVFEPGGVDPEDLSPDGLHLAVTRQSPRGQAGAVYHHVIAMAQLQEVCNVPMFKDATRPFKPTTKGTRSGSNTD
ncbi:hypothetical protein JZ751_002566 [Albula glossodonta]|uniref:Uncharacterized protein n=1 Tax=Albula glossodonta TaxID=121402 RepID=A0A8T2N774_9TELE|nr:hypothetical protein JZ751_002566 [Albula glossodonta]